MEGDNNMPYKVKETDFFKQTTVLLTSKHKNELKEIKKVATLSSNVTTDTSTLIRAMLDYVSDNPSFCNKLKNYIVTNKGFTYISKYNNLRKENKSPDEIAEILGVEIDVINKIISKEEKE